MEYTKLTIETTTEGIDRVTGIILSQDINGLEIEDRADFEEFLRDSASRYDYIDEELMQKQGMKTKVTCYLARNEQGKEQLRAIREAIGRMKEEDAEGVFGTLDIFLNSVQEEDWADNWKAFFKPFPVGKRLFVYPSWEEGSVPEGRTGLKIDPGSSFGTGQHETTKLCLEQIDAVIRGGEKVLDLGCGSGILSIAALLLGAEKAFGVDLDQNAVRVAIENAGDNGFASPRFDAVQGDLIRDEKLIRKIGKGYDVVLANIVADVLKAIAPNFKDFVKPQGKLLLSGIIDGRVDDVIKTVTDQGFTLLRTVSENDWNAAVLIRDQDRVS